jgi:hypothetical protein
MGPANWPEGASGGATAVEYPVLQIPLVGHPSSRHSLGYLTPQEFEAQSERQQLGEGPSLGSPSAR